MDEKISFTPAVGDSSEGLLVSMDVDMSNVFFSWAHKTKERNCLNI